MSAKRYTKDQKSSWLEEFKQHGGSASAFCRDREIPAYRGIDSDVIFDWQTSREYRHFIAWMGSEYEGKLQCDAYGAYRRYREEQKKSGKDVEIAACLAHIRRKFEAAKDERPEVVRWILRIIAEIYGVEKSLRLCYQGLEESMREGVDYPELRKRVRQIHSRPLIRFLGKAYKRLLVSNILPKSSLGKALQYALSIWPDMQTYLNDGRVEVDNNLVENSIRPTAVGRRIGCSQVRQSLGRALASSTDC